MIIDCCRLCSCGQESSGRMADTHDNGYESAADIQIKQEPDDGPAGDCSGKCAGKCLDKCTDKCSSNGDCNGGCDSEDESEAVANGSHEKVKQEPQSDGEAGTQDSKSETSESEDESSEEETVMPGLAQLQMMHMLAAGMMGGGMLPGMDMERLAGMQVAGMEQPSTSATMAAWQAAAQQAVLANLQLARQMAAHSDEDSQNDVDCMKRYYSKLQSLGHEDSDTDTEVSQHSVPEKSQPFVCGDRVGYKKCGMKFETKDMLTYHKTSAHGTPCTICGIKVYPLSELSEHMQETHNVDPAANKGKNFPCTICGVSFGSRSTMTAHKSQAHGSPCNLCGKRFLSDRYLGAHMREAHNGEPNKVPDGTSRAGATPTLAQSSPLRGRRDSGSDTEDPDSSKSSMTLPPTPTPPEYKPPRRVEKDIPTKIAQITALQNEALKLNSHLARNIDTEGPGRQHQDENGNPVCQLCHKKFSSFKALKIHMKDIHIGARNFTCEKCDQTFKRKGDLKSHMNKHLQPRSYKCYLCHETFNWQGNLTTHFRRKHSQEKSYQCPVCSKGFACSSGLKEHLNTHTDARPHTCDLCGKTFKSKSAHRRHLLKLHRIGSKASLDKLKRLKAVKMHECPHCDKSFRFISELHVHMGTKDPHVCRVCQKQCLCKDDYKSHMQNSHREALKEAAYECDICKRKFLKRYNWQVHMSKMHAANGELQCSQCEAVFQTEHEYNQHRQREHAARVFPCVECGSEFRSTTKLHQHMQVQHNISVEVQEQDQLLILKSADDDDDDESPVNGKSSFSQLLYQVMRRPRPRQRVISLQNQLECHVCHKTFRYNGYHFRRHLRRHKEEKQKMNQPRQSRYQTCEYCGKVLTTHLHYTTHMEEVHPDKSRTCSVCGKQFKKMFHLKFHMSHHNKTRDTPDSECKCNVCGKVFRHLSRLKRHMNAHDTERKFVCHYCGKAFKFPEGVNQHIRNSHEYVGGPHKCDMCGRMLKTLDNLKKHMELHYQGKPYECEVCGKRFARTRNRRMHAMKSHPDLYDEDSKTAKLPPGGLSQANLPHGGDHSSDDVNNTEERSNHAAI